MPDTAPVAANDTSRTTIPEAMLFQGGCKLSAEATFGWRVYRLSRHPSGGAGQEHREKNPEAARIWHYRHIPCALRLEPHKY